MIARGLLQSRSRVRAAKSRLIRHERIRSPAHPVLHILLPVQRPHRHAHAASLQVAEHGGAVDEGECSAKSPALEERPGLKGQRV